MKPLYEVQMMVSVPMRLYLWAKSERDLYDKVYAVMEDTHLPKMEMLLHSYGFQKRLEVDEMTYDITGIAMKSMPQNPYAYTPNEQYLR